MRLIGPILYLVDNPHLMSAQMMGAQLKFADSLALLRDDISTDEIIPARNCIELGDALGEYCYCGYVASGTQVVRPNDVRNGGFRISVAGYRRGKGSSREQAPFAELSAGVRVVFAKSFERIYRQNCHNIGMITSTNLALLEAMDNGDIDVDFNDLCSDLDPITREIVEAGGLLRWTRQKKSAVRETGRRAASKVPSNLVEKILDNAMVDVPGRSTSQAAFYRCDVRYSHEYVTPMAEWSLRHQSSSPTLARPESILLFEDHLSSLDLTPTARPDELRGASMLRKKQEDFAARSGLKLFRSRETAGGICHIVITDRYAWPGQLIVGSDSHTPHLGGIGCLAIGVGATDISNSWSTGNVLLSRPRTLCVDISGRLHEDTTEKDIMLNLLARAEVREGAAIGTVVEFMGEAIEALDVEARCTMTNMAAEMGATSGIVAADDKTAHFLTLRGIGLPEAERRCHLIVADAGASHDAVIHLNADDVEPMVALPGDPGNAIAMREVGDVPITRAYGGSCTASKRTDMDLYARVVREALSGGFRVHKSVEFFIQYGSSDIHHYCLSKGYTDLFEAIGVHMLEPSCGACINAGPGVSTSPDEVGVSAQNRNFPGRSGPGSLYLASPLSVAASAVMGRLTSYEPGMFA